MGRAAKVRYLAKYAAQAAAITAKYTDYKLGKNQPARKAPARGASIKAALASFDTRATTKTTVVTVSGRAMVAGTRTATGATDIVLNIESTTIPAEAKKVSGYKPAKVTIFIPTVAGLAGAPAPTQGSADAVSPAGTGSADDTTLTPLSRITGLEYRRRLGNSYTYPFGSSATAGQTNEEGMMNYVYRELGVGGKTLSFHSEVPAKPNRR
ncbi:MAG: hypothetical protein JGK38_23925 [Microcoleus sp. PH2017_15_JOR_U_A]|uniref:hypothetical protein n=1 Tax=unclassified Microcoleus TaxID=2642155 RepID=UPI001D3E63E0|nr:MULTISPECIES: hypothetical protein [unclassified Microcoleus]MCC3473308.1 hypothetical protein [Microcoleus sp. PH2017_13_LAR_U_A]MCC3486526.1 hypothetical protein [Microcoleus sp. PH2017_14_LAR_D_A]MCC3499606.1 hypothetical protein [Microcoleus sp. PH2017_15_JOR_U_A]MCC3600177.1 hypothetical protein [Microcoleus sp. PH2017_26_ELK_O_A]MCC3623168.1 hypothetical protein [Microcoleus sp. PH2017_36_ELK_O_B]